MCVDISPLLGLRVPQLAGKVAKGTTFSYCLCVCVCVRVLSVLSFRVVVIVIVLINGDNKKVFAKHLTSARTCVPT